jgi:hypothetical protein
MKFNTYDVVTIKNRFSVEKQGNKLFFPAGIEGVIVECYSNEYLVEFVDTTNDTLYVLLGEQDIAKKWDANTGKYSG